MNLLVITIFSTVSIGQVLADDMCELNKNLIKNRLKQSGFVGEGMVNALSPKIDIAAVTLLENELKKNSPPKELMSKEEQLRLDKYKDELMQIPPLDKQTPRYKEIAGKKSFTEAEIAERKEIIRIINYSLMSPTNKADYSNLKNKYLSSRVNDEINALAKNQYREYFRAEIKKKLITKADKLHLNNKNFSLDIDSSAFGNPDKNPAWFDEYYPNLNYSDFKEHNSESNYRLMVSDEMLGVNLDSYSNKGNEDLNELLSSYKKTPDSGISKFINDYSKSNSEHKKSMELDEIRGDVKSTLNMKTGEITTSYRAILLMKDGNNFVNYPEKYVSLDEMANLLLPKSCLKTSSKTTILDRPRSSIENKMGVEMTDRPPENVNGKEK